MNRALLAVALGAALLCPAPGAARDVAQFVDPPDYVLRTTGAISSLQLLADPAGGLHLLFLDHTRQSGPSEKPQLMYCRWTDGAWSAPVAILGGRDGMSLRQVRAALDADGLLHLVVASEGSLLWSLAAHLSRAAEADVWTWADAVGDAQVRGFDLAVAPEGTLHVAAVATDGTVLHWRSTDGGASWSEGATVIPPPQGEAPEAARIAVAPGGAVFVTWTQYVLPRGWPPSGGYFSASADDGATWSAPLALAGEGVLPAVIGLAADGAVHVFARDSTGCSRAHAQHSRDRGLSWQVDEVPASELCAVGTRPDSFLTDSAGRLLLVSQLASGHQTALSFGLSVWKDPAWSPPLLIASEEMPTPRGGANDAVVRLGNDLHYVFAVEGRGIAHGRLLLSAPPLPPRPLAPPRSPFANLRPGRLSGKLWTALALGAALLSSLRRGRRVKRRDPWDSVAKLLTLLAAAAVFAMARVPGGPWVEAPLWIGLVAVLVLYPPTLLTALVVAGMLAARTFPTGTDTDVPLTLVLLGIGGVLLIVRSLRTRSAPELRDPIVLLVLGLCVAATLSFGIANTSAYPAAVRAPLRAQAGALGTYWACLIALLVAMRWASRPGVLPRLHWIFLGLTAVYVAARTVPELHALWPVFKPRVWGSVACVWAVALAFGQGGWNYDLGGPRRLVLLALVVAILADAIGLNRAWLAGWVPATVGVGAIALRGGWARPLVLGLRWLRARPLYAAAAALAAVAVLFWQRDRLIGLVAVGDNPYSLATRIDAARIMLQIAALRPLLGIGPANYFPLTASYAIRGNAVTFSSHNNYLDILAQTGAIGLLLFLAAYALALRRAWRLAVTAAPGFSRAFALGALGGLAGTLVAALLGDWVIPFVYNRTLMELASSTYGWMFLGCLLAVAQGRTSGGRWRGKAGGPSTEMQSTSGASSPLSGGAAARGRKRRERE